MQDPDRQQGGRPTIACCVLVAALAQIHAMLLSQISGALVGRLSYVRAVPELCVSSHAKLSRPAVGGFASKITQEWDPSSSSNCWNQLAEKCQKIFPVKESGWIRMSDAVGGGSQLTWICSDGGAQRAEPGCTLFLFRCLADVCIPSHVVRLLCASAGSFLEVFTLFTAALSLFSSFQTSSYSPGTLNDP